MSISEVTLDAPIKAQNAYATTVALGSVVIAEGMPVGFLNHLKGCMARYMPKNSRHCIAEATYLYASRRGFAPGHALDDWVVAENEINPRLAGEGYVF